MAVSSIPYTPDKLDFAVTAQYVDVCADFLSHLANAADLSDFRGIPAEQLPAIAELADSVYGGF